ncbi:uncharacterized protein EI97DRAFT_455364 [Westerdykella ornata]|uniref:Fungal N-terminal domain-containing protein n=1 Tax=Westerdykella ornata TaxID=318751 RepID=A0A6A6JW87_WESOR|nr:uncharacterized protein EI97DRAFT_455364 [Westerdykella ornata]KAF2280474.1 hypothetical protein EI97DRAFT_455364 [Westerdykella ornata]
MTDPLSITASIVAIAVAGIKVSVALFGLAEQVVTARERVENIANDISSTCAILNQLHDLIGPDPGHDGARNSLFTQTALSDILGAIQHCDRMFHKVQVYLKKASRQIKQSAVADPQAKKVELSRSERAKWPFLQPQFDELRNDLRDSKGNLLLMIAVANLTLAERSVPCRVVDETEK